MDTTKTTTTAGTQLDSDTRWQKMYQKGIELLVWAVNQLVELAPVECMWVGGNHDQMLSYTATCHVDAYFRLFDAVTVNTSPKPRQYIEYGKCAIGFSHGEEEGKRIYGLMQIEVPEMWGRTKFREMHLGHLHQEGKKDVLDDIVEQNGVIVRHIAALSGRDAWTNKKGYMSLKKAQAFVWDRERGLEMIIHSGV